MIAFSMRALSPHWPLWFWVSVVALALFVFYCFGLAEEQREKERATRRATRTSNTRASGEDT